eukprot:gene11415-9922_t
MSAAWSRSERQPLPSRPHPDRPPARAMDFLRLPSQKFEAA